MNSQVLASINPTRHITHEAGKVVYIHWDQHQFSLTRSRFVHLVRALEHGSKRMYAEEDGQTVVQVDEDLREVWIEDSCILVNRHEYRALLNAALRTETRLHGFHTMQQDNSGERLLTLYRIPRPTRACWN